VSQPGALKRSFAGFEQKENLMFFSFKYNFGRIEFR